MSIIEDAKLRELGKQAETQNIEGLAAQRYAQEHAAEYNSRMQDAMYKQAAAEQVYQNTITAQQMLNRNAPVDPSVLGAPQVVGNRTFNPAEGLAGQPVTNDRLRY